MIVPGARFAQTVSALSALRVLPTPNAQRDKPVHLDPALLHVTRSARTVSALVESVSRVVATRIPSVWRTSSASTEPAPTAPVRQMLIVVTDSLVRRELVLLTSVYPTPTALPRKLASLEPVLRDAQRPTTAISTRSASLECAKLFVPPTQTAPLVKPANLACVLLPHVQPTASVLQARPVKQGFVLLPVLPRAPPTASVLPARPVKPVFVLLLILLRVLIVASVAPAKPVRTGLAWMHVHPTLSAATVSPVLTEVAPPLLGVPPTLTVAPARSVLLEPALPSAELTQVVPWARSAKAEFVLLAHVLQTANATPTRLARMDLVLPTLAPPTAGARPDEFAKTGAALSPLNVLLTLNAPLARSVRAGAALLARVLQTVNAAPTRFARTDLVLPTHAPPIASARLDKSAKPGAVLSPLDVLLTLNAPLARSVRAGAALPSLYVQLTLNALPVRYARVTVVSFPVTMPPAAKPATLARAESALSTLAVYLTTNAPRTRLASKESALPIPAPRMMTVVRVKPARANSAPWAVSLTTTAMLARLASRASVPLLDVPAALTVTRESHVSPTAVPQRVAPLAASVQVARPVSRAFALHLAVHLQLSVLAERNALAESVPLVKGARLALNAALVRAVSPEAVLPPAAQLPPSARVVRTVLPASVLQPDAQQTMTVLQERIVLLLSARPLSLALPIQTVPTARFARTESVSLGLQLAQPAVTAELVRVAYRELAHPTPRDVRQAATAALARAVYRELAHPILQDVRLVPTAALARAVYLVSVRHPPVLLIAIAHLLRPARLESVQLGLRRNVSLVLTAILARAVYQEPVHLIPQDAHRAPTVAVVRVVYLGFVHHPAAPLTVTVPLPRPARLGFVLLGLQQNVNPVPTATLERAVSQGLAHRIPQDVQLAPTVVVVRVVYLGSVRHPTAPLTATAHLVRPVRPEFALPGLQRTVNRVLTATLERVAFQELAHPTPQDVQPVRIAAVVRAAYLAFARHPSASLILIVLPARPVMPVSVLPVLPPIVNLTATVVTARAVCPGLAHLIPRDVHLALTVSLARVAYLASAHHPAARPIANVPLPRHARPGSAQLGLRLVANPALIVTTAQAACPGPVRLIQQAAQLAANVLQARAVSLEFALHLVALRIVSVRATKPALAESAQLAPQSAPWTLIVPELERLAYLGAVQLHPLVPLIPTVQADRPAYPEVAQLVLQNVLWTPIALDLERLASPAPV